MFNLGAAVTSDVYVHARVDDHTLCGTPVAEGAAASVEGHYFDVIRDAERRHVCLLCMELAPDFLMDTKEEMLHV